MMSFFSDPSSWVLVAFILFVIIALVIKAPAMIANLLDGEIKKIKDELDNARKLKEEANSLLAQHERKIQNADEEAEKIISQAKEIAANQEAQSKIKTEEYVKRAEQQAIEKIERKLMKVLFFFEKIYLLASFKGRNIIFFSVGF